MKILVTGATGTVGGQLVQQLSKSPASPEHTLRVIVRQPEQFAHPDPVEVVTGDLTKPDEVRAALTGVQRAFLNMADDNGAVFAAVAGELGLDHVVLLSSFTAAHDLPSGDKNIIAARHRAGERALANAGVPSTFLRAAGFDNNILMWTTALASEGIIRAPYPDVALPVVDPADIAAAAAAVLLSDTPIPQAYSITGATDAHRPASRQQSSQ